MQDDLGKQRFRIELRLAREAKHQQEGSLISHRELLAFAASGKSDVKSGVINQRNVETESKEI